jgi:hypothetical protein
MFIFSQSPDVLLQVGWSQIVTALVNQKTLLELDALPDFKHVKFITEDWSDVVILADRCNETSRSVDGGLDLVELLLR